jgi:hypothetical protein
VGLNSGQGSNIKPNPNALVGVNGTITKRAPSTGRNGVQVGDDFVPNENFYKNNKRAQSLERAAAVHSSGNPGLNSLSRGTPMGALDSFNSGQANYS